MFSPGTRVLYHFNDSSHHSFMESMAKLLWTEYTDGQIFLPEMIGTGFLKNVYVEEGLSVRNLSFNLAIDFDFVRLAKKEEEEKIFQLYYFLNNTDFHFTLGDDAEPLKPAAFSKTIFFSNDMTVHGRFGKNDSVKVIVLSFSISWLKTNGFGSYEWFKPLLESTESKHAMLLLEDLDMADFTTATELHDIIVPNSEFTFPIKADVFQLIKRFCSAIEKRDNLSIHKGHSDYFFQMVKVEQRIRDYLTASLPVIKNLSKEFNMSDSNLKRHFHTVYGKNIYEYYLEKKMGLAKDMIVNEGRPVSIVAYSLGYEKVGSFSKAFKKMYGVLPSEVKGRQSPLP